MNETSKTEDEELEALYAAMAEEYDDSYRMNDAPIDLETGDYLVTFEGRRRVLGGLGTGTPDAFAT